MSDEERQAAWKASQDRPRFIHRINEVDGKLERESYVYWTPEGAIELWRRPYREGSLFSSESGYYGGVETHSPIQWSEWNDKPLDGCSWVRGGKCFTDGSSMAFDGFEYDFDSPAFLREELKDWHKSRFGESEYDRAMTLHRFATLPAFGV